MKKKLSKGLGSRKIQLLITACILFLGSCNEKGKKTDQAETPTQQAEAGQPAPLANTLDNFPLLYTEFQAITTAFNTLPPGQSRKMVFQFHFDGGANGQPTLRGFLAKQNFSYTTTVPLVTLSRSSVSLPLPYPLNLGNLELSRAEYDVLNADANKKTYLYFIPKKSVMPGSEHVVTYTTAWSNSATVTLKELSPIKISITGDELNPSPPKNPN